MGHGDYDGDFFDWTQRQAQAIRAAAAIGLLPGIDAENVAEEIESSGRMQLADVRMQVLRFLEAAILGAVAPEVVQVRGWQVREGRTASGGSVDHLGWRGRCTNASIEVASRLTPAMEPLVDVDALWRQARKGAALSIEAARGHRAELGLPNECPLTLDQISDREVTDLDWIAARVAGTAAPKP